MAEGTPLPERYGHRMKAIQPIRRAAAWGLSALALSTVLFCSVACTRGERPSSDTTEAATSPVTTPSTGSNAPDTRPLDPDRGTVDSNGDPGDPPTGTEADTKGRGLLPGHRG